MRDAAGETPMPVMFRDNFEHLLKKTSEYMGVSDLELIRRAYEFADKSLRQRGIVRMSGEPAIVHALEVANKLADWRLDSATIAAGVLHDVIEDPEVHQLQIRATFMDQVSLLVEGVTKLKGYRIGGADDNVTYQVNVFLATASDVRVALIKLADRLHNMGTLEFLPAARRERNCRETRDLFIPLARFVGMEKIQQELEDLSFRFAEAPLYERTVAQIDQVIDQEDAFFEEKIKEFRARFRKRFPFVQVHEEYNSVYEIFQRTKGSRNFRKKTGYLQIVVDTVQDCYLALGEAHALFQSVPGSLVDTIHHPDPNLKRWIRTELIDSGGNPFIVEILTREMKLVNEIGIIPYFMAPQSLERTDFLAARMNEIQSIIDAYSGKEDEKDKRIFLEILSGDILKRDIYVITRDGRRVSLPVNATALDFAYAEGKDIGDRFSFAVVNNQKVDAGHALISCDQVQVFTDDTHHPNLDWLDSINSTGAKYAIIDTLRRQPIETARKNGFDALRRAVIEGGLSHSLNPGDIEAMLDDIIEFLSLSGRDEFYAVVGYGEIPVSQAIDALKEQRKRDSLISQRELTTAISSHPALTRVYPPALARLDKGTCSQVQLCDICTPLPGDEIEGYITARRLVLHHQCRRRRIPIVSGKRVGVHWGDTTDMLFPVRVKVKLFHRQDFYREMREIVGEHRSNILAARTDLVADDGLALPEFLLEAPSVTTLESICGGFLGMKDVIAVTRI